MGAGADWENESPLNVRTKLGLRVLLLMFKIISPYRFEHRFEKDIKQLEQLIANVEDEPEVKK